MNIEKVNLKDYTSLRVGGESEMTRVKNNDELLEAIKYAEENNKKIFILGEGTNTYFNEHMKELLAIKIEMKGIEKVPHQTVQDGGEYVIIKAFAGETWDDVVKYAVVNGWWGIENLSSVPGTCGAGPVQNIGAYGVELCDSYVSTEVLNRESKQIETLTNHECEFGYRDSIFKKYTNKFIILSVNLKLSKAYKPTLTYAPLNSLDQSLRYTPKQIRDIIIKTRVSKIPDYNLLPNAGSFFKNPIINKELKEKLLANYPDIPIYAYEDKYKTSAAYLIEKVAKMKGVREGDVGTHIDQALIIINYGSASSEDVNNFANKIINKIKSETGIELEREVNYVE